MQPTKKSYLKVINLAILLALSSGVSSSGLANESITMSASSTKNSQSLEIAQAGTTLYAVKSQWNREQFSLVVKTGHEKQRGEIVIDGASVQAFNLQNQLLWEDSRVDQKVCLPELFGEFIRAHLEELKQGQSISCVGPIIKAKKLAPFKIYLEKQTNNALLFKVGPGSIGMWFFMDEVSISMNTDATQILSYRGVSPAPKTLEGKMAYLSIVTPLTEPLDVAELKASILW
ncbi:hypothetical protein [Vibrio genomosp. F10]|uniref:hypothetical protein n=1 Tax=Vibrio genomosp. F10 TaxID=723171 RepID=UPI0002F4D029|nr:hypothetical protein [Vibrio genomosp. F10]OEE90256.1 hypothetical protein A1QK_18515 [Vibrio genomosp. F10 str. 9ZD137]